MDYVKKLIPRLFGEEPVGLGKNDEEETIIDAVTILDEATEMLRKFNITEDDENHIDDAAVDEMMTSITPGSALSVHAALMRSRSRRLNECRKYIFDSLRTILKKQYFVTQASADQLLDIFHRDDNFNNDYKALRRVLRNFDNNENDRKAFQEYVSFTLFQTPTFEHSNMQVWLRLLRISYELSNVCCEFISKFKLDAVNDLNVVMFFNETHWMRKNQFQLDVRAYLMENAARLIVDRLFEHIQPEAMWTLIREHFEDVEPLKASVDQLFLGVYRHVAFFTNVASVAENLQETGYMELFLSKMSIFEFLRCIRCDPELFSFEERRRIGIRIILKLIPAYACLQLVPVVATALICYYFDVPVISWAIEIAYYLTSRFN